ncbi:PHD and RING finger domain-containing protein 1 [Arapaima gigas]
MDDEDSQDELINRNVSHGKGKRPASSVFTDEEDDTDEHGSSAEEEIETDSGNGDEDDDDDDDGEDENEEDEEQGDSDDADEHSGKAADGTAREAVAVDGDISSDEDAEKCPICLNSFQQQPLATPENCEHYFCLDCILEWSKNANSCPVDRIAFKNICLRRCYGGEVQKMMTVQKPAKITPEQTEVDLDQTNCEVCGRSDREDRLLLCDGCDAGYHMECLTPPLNSIPVEEWFCPECAASNPLAGASSEEVSDGELVALTTDIVPTTSSLRASSNRPTRAIARTRQSERVRATVNRNRITQARTIQHVPQYLMQSTWLDETIEAVVAGLNTDVYVRDLAPRSGSGRQRNSAKRKHKNKKAKSKRSSDTSSKGKTGGKRLKRRKRCSRKSRSRRKQVLKKEVTPRSRLAKSLGIGMPIRNSSIPSVYRPAEQSLGSMRADIGAASLSIYGDPFDLDPFDDGNDQQEQPPAPSHLYVKRRGLSRSALRSHQPVARPIPVGLQRRDLGIPELVAGAEAEAKGTPVPDLLGSILSSQSMLMMDSADVVINRDGSLKAIKPVSIPSPKARIPSGGVCQATAEIHVGTSPSSGTSAFHASGDAGLSGGFTVRSSPFSFSSLSPGTLTSPQLASFSPLPHPTSLSPHVPLSSPIAWSPTTPGSPFDQVPSGQSPICPASTSRSGIKEGVMLQGKKVFSKPMWVDVSGLPRIPKIKRETPVGSTAEGNNGRCSSIPESCMNSLTGDRVRQQTVGQGASGCEQGRVGGSDSRQRRGGEGSSTSFSSSISSAPPAGNIGSSSTVSFRISSSGNSWHARRLAHARAQGAAQPCKKLHESEQTQGKDKPTKSEIYDPFDPTGSDSDSPTSASEIETVDSQPQLGLLGKKRGQTCNAGSNQEDIKAVSYQAKVEPPNSDIKVEGESSKNSTEVKKDMKHSAGLSDSLKSTCSSAESSSESPGFPKVWGTVGTGAKASVFIEEDETSQDLKALPQTWTRSRSTSTSSHYSEISIKKENSYEVEGHCSQARSPSSALTDGKQDSIGRKIKDSCSFSSSPDSSKRKTETKGKRTEKRAWCSRSNDHKRTVFPSDTESEDSEKSWRKLKHSQSGVGDRGRSRSSSGDRCKREKLSKKNRERNDRKSSEGSKDFEEKWHCQFNSQSRPRSRSRSRSCSRSRSRERRQDRMQSFSKSKHRGRSQSKDKRQPKSRSKSRESKNENCPSDSVQTTAKTSPPPASAVTVSRDLRQPKTITVEKSYSLVKEAKDPKGITSKECISLKMDMQVNDSKEVRKEKMVPSSNTYEVKEPKEIKKEKSVPLEMFRESKEHKVFKNEKSLPLSQAKKLKNPTEVKPEQVSLSLDKEVEYPETLAEHFSEYMVEDMKAPQVKVELYVKEEKSSADIREQTPHTGEASASVSYKVKKKTGGAGMEVKMDVSQQKIKTEPLWIEETMQPSCQSKMPSSIQSLPTVAGIGHMGTIRTCDTSPRNIPMGKVDLAPLNAVGDCKREEKISEDSSVIMDQFQGNLSPIKTEKVETSEPSSSVKSYVTVDTSIQRPEGLASIKEEIKQEELSVNKTELPLAIQLEKQSVVKEKEHSLCKEEVIPAIGSERLFTGKQEELTTVAITSESALVIAGTKSKPPVKRVTWNLKEADKLPCEKFGKQSHLKLPQSSRESSRRPASTSKTISQGSSQVGGHATLIHFFLQDPPQETAPIAPVGESPTPVMKKGISVSVPHETQLGSEAHPGQSQPSQGTPAAKRKETTQNASQKDKYMKKLHMQERAVEEVKLAIKPFYQKRDITKDEYKDILRKAVQKVCHSKSGEINPVKVANLVKAYVDKYKHTRKHKKGGGEGKAQEAEKLKATDNS